MGAPKVSEQEFIRLFQELKSPTAVSKVTGQNVRSVYNRMARIEEKTGHRFDVEKSTLAYRRSSKSLDVYARLEVKDAVFVVYSDAHFWPGYEAVAYRGLLKFLPTIKPQYVIDAGDSLDAATISRHPPIGWEARPNMAQELKACQDGKKAIREACPKAKRFWLHSNHQLRFDRFFATHTAQMQGVGGTKLTDHFPDETYIISLLVNEHTLFIHSIRSGIHAQWNNTGAAGISVVSGHLHAQQIKPRSSFSPVNGGTMYGVDVGTLCDIDAPQFNYREGRPSDWRSGFAVLTFRDGNLMPPELATVVDHDKGLMFWRGQITAV